LKIIEVIERILTILGGVRAAAAPSPARRVDLYQVA
jgi:hypothetical protein